MCVREREREREEDANSRWVKEKRSIGQKNKKKKTGPVAWDHPDESLFKGIRETQLALQEKNRNPILIRFFSFPNVQKPKNRNKNDNPPSEPSGVEAGARRFSLAGRGQKAKEWREGT